MWTQTGKLLAPDATPGWQAFDFFGYSVNMHEDRLVVGSPDDGPGAAYVFEREGAAWAFRAKLVASDEILNEELGNSVAIHGDIVLAGAPSDDDAGETWYFQGWYRDPMGPCGTAFNLSNGLAVTFAP